MVVKLFFRIVEEKVIRWSPFRGSAAEALFLMAAVGNNKRAKIVVKGSLAKGSGREDLTMEDQDQPGQQAEHMNVLHTSHDTNMRKL